MRVAATAVAIVAALGCSDEDPPPAVEEPIGLWFEAPEPFAPAVSSTNASSSDNGACGTGCSVDPPDNLADARTTELIAQYRAEPADAPSLALETLLFHRDSTLAYLERHGGGLPSSHRRLLARELARTHANVEMRVIDEHGVVRARLPETRVRLGHKEHLHFVDRVRLQPFEAAGTVVRTGLVHLWSRY